MTSRIVGFENAVRKLEQLEVRLARRVVLTAMNKATRPIKARMRARAPVGTKPHKTYKGRWVSPGFLKRSIKSVRNPKDFQIIIGVEPEAFYGVQFFDKGTTVTKRVKGIYAGSKRKTIKPYTLKAHRWFLDQFFAGRRQLEADIATNLVASIRKI